MLTAPQEGRKYFADEQITGLYLMVSATGVRSFVFRYSAADGRRKKHHIGRWPDWNATMAREEVLSLRRKLAQGIDPGIERREARQGMSELTLAQVADDYLERYASRKKSGARDREILARDVLPKIGSNRAKTLSRGDVRRIFEAKTSVAPVGANRLLACLSRLFNWAIEQEIVDVNPCQGIRKNRERARDRVLTEAELRTLWQALDASPGVSDGVRAALKLILLTAQRPGEVVGIRWSEIEGNWWMLPGSRTKNGKPHRVPLCETAHEVLELQRGDGDVVFPARRGTGATLLVNSLSRAIRNCGFFGINPWAPHDLRRTAATTMASAGVQPHILDRVLNHTDSSVRARHYDLYRYDSEKLAALEKWQEILRFAVLADKDCGAQDAVSNRRDGEETAR